MFLTVLKNRTDKNGIAVYFVFGNPAMHFVFSLADAPQEWSLGRSIDQVCLLRMVHDRLCARQCQGHPRTIHPFPAGWNRSSTRFMAGDDLRFPTGHKQGRSSRSKILVVLNQRYLDEVRATVFIAMATFFLLCPCRTALPVPCCHTLRNPLTGSSVEFGTSHLVCFLAEQRQFWVDRSSTHLRHRVLKVLRTGCI